jgi:antitoxin component of MazEF toxin-antitoxin module
MKKYLTTVGNSKALILPKALIEKYKLNHVFIEEKKDGIFIKSVEEESTFEEMVEAAKLEKDSIYNRMKEQTEDPETIAYYSNSDLSEVDVDFIE